MEVDVEPLECHSAWDGGWYDVDLKASMVIDTPETGPVVKIHFRDNPESMDEFLTLDALDCRLKLGASPVQDDECQRLRPDTAVLMLYTYKEGDTRYYAAVIDKAIRKAHPPVDGLCRCEFDLRWTVEPPLAHSHSLWTPPTLTRFTIENMCFPGGPANQHPTVEKWRQQLTDLLDQHARAPDTFSFPLPTQQHIDEETAAKRAAVLRQIAASAAAAKDTAQQVIIDLASSVENSPMRPAPIAASSPSPGIKLHPAHRLAAQSLPPVHPVPAAPPAGGGNMVGRWGSGLAGVVEPVVGPGGVPVRQPTGSGPMIAITGAGWAGDGTPGAWGAGGGDTYFPRSHEAELSYKDMLKRVVSVEQHEAVQRQIAQRQPHRWLQPEHYNLPRDIQVMEKLRVDHTGRPTGARDKLYILPTGRVIRTKWEVEQIVASRGAPSGGHTNGTVAVNGPGAGAGGGPPGAPAAPSPGRREEKQRQSGGAQEAAPGDSPVEVSLTMTLAEVVAIASCIEAGQLELSRGVRQALFNCLKAARLEQRLERRSGVQVLASCAVLLDVDEKPWGQGVLDGETPEVLPDRSGKAEAYGSQADSRPLAGGRVKTEEPPVMSPRGRVPSAPSPHRPHATAAGTAAANDSDGGESRGLSATASSSGRPPPAATAGETASAEDEGGVAALRRVQEAAAARPATAAEAAAAKVMAVCQPGARLDEDAARSALVLVKQLMVDSKRVQALEAALEAAREPGPGPDPGLASDPAPGLHPGQDSGPAPGQDPVQATGRGLGLSEQQRSTLQEQLRRAHHAYLNIYRLILRHLASFREMVDELAPDARAAVQWVVRTNPDLAPQPSPQPPPWQPVTSPTSGTGAEAAAPVPGVRGHRLGRCLVPAGAVALSHGANSTSKMLPVGTATTAKRTAGASSGLTSASGNGTTAATSTDLNHLQPQQQRQLSWTGQGLATAASACPGQPSNPTQAEASPDPFMPAHMSGSSSEAAGKHATRLTQPLFEQAQSPAIAANGQDGNRQPTNPAPGQTPHLPNASVAVAAVGEASSSQPLAALALQGQPKKPMLAALQSLNHTQQLVSASPAASQPSLATLLGPIVLSPVARQQTGLEPQTGAGQSGSTGPSQGTTLQGPGTLPHGRAVSSAPLPVRIPAARGEETVGAAPYNNAGPSGANVVAGANLQINQLAGRVPRPAMKVAQPRVELEDLGRFLVAGLLSGPIGVQKSLGEIAAQPSAKHNTGGAGGLDAAHGPQGMLKRPRLS